jgi:hypothetical protein
LKEKRKKKKEKKEERKKKKRKKINQKNQKTNRQKIQKTPPFQDFPSTGVSIFHYPHPPVFSPSSFSNRKSEIFFFLTASGSFSLPPRDCQVFSIFIEDDDQRLSCLPFQVCPLARYPETSPASS